MPYIKTIPPAEATGKLKEVYGVGGAGKSRYGAPSAEFASRCPRGVERPRRRDHARAVELDAAPARNDRDRCVGDESL